MYSILFVSKKLQNISNAETLRLCNICIFFFYSITGLDRLLGLQYVRLLELLYSRHMKVVRLLHLRTGRLTPWRISGTHSCYSLCRPQEHSAPGRIKAMKNLNYPIGNRTHDIAACSAVPRLVCLT